MTSRWDNNKQMITLPLPTEFSFLENTKYLSNAPNECLIRIDDGRVYKAISLEQVPIIVEVSVGCEQENGLAVRLLGNNQAALCESVRDAAVRYVRDWFDLDTDLQPFYQLAKTDKLLSGSVDSFYGLRNMGIPDLFEALCWGIIGQQINLAFAYTLKRRFVEAFGQYVEHDGERYWLFPTPVDIASLQVEDITKLKMSTKKSEYLIGVAQLMVEGKLSKEQLLGIGDHKKIEKLLVQIRGIGPWTANYVLMRCLRIPTAFPIDDVGLHNAIKYVTGAEAKPTKVEILQLAEGWKNWESYATFYLWRLLY
ncbi:DNA-3-methyladenine glycosylase family protein [Paenibacillus arenosi]|uniref:DNA-3-methyladenine glycosylase II n=1 Tax=Paenibacillus arenosi TaxID=2774142 RepID=A0ABR9AUY4_9BACL|nr:DNA-3-methyladenine glycosylase [Paenibacillus arenosi]MBD8497926.1 DNA-3-methyladenine glycosylase 2 family protein [Paenibacillus arenosi]